MTLILALAGLILVIDQLSKYYVQELILPGQSIPVLKNIFHLTHIHNTGAAFGILRHQTAFLIFISILSVILIIYLQRKFSRRYPDWTFSIGLILGGATGNLIDRVRFGYVVDFLDFSLYDHHWPAFNLADSAITVGVIILCWKMLRERKKG
ncbi:signal peptidase II [bacterium]|nr:signal peptidase II [bacterium]MCK4325477.1 signal peptidase II [bacterium]MCK4436799.1 signal peptidase II [bacterium]